METTTTPIKRKTTTIMTTGSLDYKNKARAIENENNIIDNTSPKPILYKAEL